MKVTMRKGEPGFENFDQLLKYHVTLDDRDVKNCIAFDTEEGTVEIWAGSLTDEYVINEARDDIARTILKGRVAFTTSPRAKELRYNETTESERLKYEKVWAHAEYAESSPGERNVMRAIAALELRPSEFFIDFGSGSCKMLSALWDMGFHRFLGIDIASNAQVGEAALPVLVSAIHNAPRIVGVDAGICIDVMEHIPTFMVDTTLESIAAIAPRVYFRIALFPDGHGPQFGLGALHLTVQTAQWWEDTLKEHFASVKQLDSGEALCAAFLVEVA